jgi:2-methylcitrate dehydratase
LRTSEAANLIINKAGPLQNAADRDHCIQYVVALSFLKGSAPEATDYSDGSPWAVSAELAHLRRKISVHPDPQLTRGYLDLDIKSIGTGLTVVLVDGTVLPEVLVEYPIGHVRDTRTKQALQKKFMHNMAYLFSETEITHILHAVENMNTPVIHLVDLLARPVAKGRL